MNKTARNIAGYFGKISLANVGLFGRSKKAMVYIENEILGTIQEIGFDNFFIIIYSFNLLSIYKIIHLIKQKSNN